uniref:Torsin-1B n=1 Tax=Caenorhabditis tropicalis TaxID=1561998 RepID=A0A1I7UXT0_9PELO
MVQTRKSLGTPSIDTNARIKRRSLEIQTFKNVYPVLTETTSYATTIQTSELQDEEDVYETENDSSFASSLGSNSSTSTENESWKIVAIAIVSVLIAIIVGLTMKNQKVDTSYENYIKSVRSTIKDRFPTISKENRDLLRLIGQKVFLEPENHAPLVVLVGGNVAKELSEAVHQAVQDAKTEEHKTKKNPIRVETDTNRAELHENLRGILGPSLTSQTSPRSAVVMDVDLLKWDAVLVLHAFADHENYPVPKTVLFLTVSDPGLFNETHSGNCDEKMVGFLTSRWIQNGGTSDNIPPIIARISYFLCL